MKILWSRVLKIIKRVNIGNKDQFKKKLNKPYNNNSANMARPWVAFSNPS